MNIKFELIKKFKNNGFKVEEINYGDFSGLNVVFVFGEIRDGDGYDTYSVEITIGVMTTKTVDEVYNVAVDVLLQKAKDFLLTNKGKNYEKGRRK